MVITRRSSGNYDNCSVKNGSDVALLERKTPETYNEYIGKEEIKTENLSEAKERMQRNLDKLLNYDRYSETVDSTAPQTFAASENIIEEKAVSAETITAMSDDDIRPTSTTMQFGDIDTDNMVGEMHNDEKDEDVYHMNKKGKFAVVLYAIAVTVILALIILNTGVLSALSVKSSEKLVALNGIASEYSSVNEQIAQKTADDYVAQVAESEYGMIKG